MSRKHRNRHVRRMVAETFDPAILVKLCEMDEYAFGAYADRFDLPGTDRHYHFADHGSDILAVAHLDTVARDRSTVIVDSAAGPVVHGGALDDRLGAYVVCELLPHLGVKVDLLLTTDEETGQSTAEEFQTVKPYNWIIEFDRGGSDVVMYQYETTYLRGLVNASGARVGVGSFSDIASLEHLGVAAFNWGVGYDGNYHSVRGYAFLTDTFAMVDKFLRFHAANATRRLPHSERSHRILSSAQRDTSRWDQEWSAMYEAMYEREASPSRIGDVLRLPRGNGEPGSARPAWWDADDSLSVDAAMRSVRGATMAADDECPRCRCPMIERYCGECGTDWDASEVTR